jgi:hypothetical protein
MEKEKERVSVRGRREKRKRMREFRGSSRPAKAPHSTAEGPIEGR